MPTADLSQPTYLPKHSESVPLLTPYDTKSTRTYRVSSNGFTPHRGSQALDHTGAEVVELLQEKLTGAGLSWDADSSTSIIANAALADEDARGVRGSPADEPRRAASGMYDQPLRGSGSVGYYDEQFAGGRFHGGHEADPNYAERCVAQGHARVDGSGVMVRTHDG